MILELRDSSNGRLIASIPEKDQNDDFSLTVFEDQKVYFRVKLPSQCDEVELFVTDIAISPNRIERIDDCYNYYSWTSVGHNAFFQNIYGNCSLKLFFTQEDGTNRHCDFSPIDIVGSKLSEREITHILNYLSQKSPESIWTLCAATQVKTAFRSNSKDCFEFFREAEIGAEVLERTFPRIIEKPCSRLVPRKRLMPASHSSVYDPTAVDWLVSNLDVLEPSPATPEALNVLWRYYTPREIEVEELIENTNVYENQIIYAYLINIIDFLTQFVGQFHDEANNELELAQNGRTPLFMILKRENARIYATYVSKTHNLLNRFRRLKRLLEGRLKVQEGNPSPPIFTAKVRSDTYYRDTFERIAIWHSLGSPDWTPANSFAGIKSIDQIYEIYCYHRIFDSILANGFSLIVDENTDKKNQSHLSFVKDDIIIEFYHERKFRAFNFYGYEEEFMHIEKWTQTTTPRAGTGPFSCRIPDFTLTVCLKSQGTKFLVLFDAKYTTHKLAFQKYLPECTMKYVHGIGRSGGGCSPVSLFYILYAGTPNVHSNKSELHYAEDRYNLYSSKTHTPCLGAVELSPRDRWDFDFFIGKAISIAANECSKSIVFESTYDEV
jgi:hypothetical protein